MTIVFGTRFLHWLFQWAVLRICSSNNLPHPVPALDDVPSSNGPVLRETKRKRRRRNRSKRRKKKLQRITDQESLQTSSLTSMGNGNCSQSDISACCVFVFEIPNPAWFRLPLSKRKKLLSNGFLHFSRLKFIADLLVVHQPVSGTQVTVAHDLSIPHGQGILTQDYTELANFSEKGINVSHFHCHPTSSKLKQSNSNKNYIQTIYLDITIPFPWAKVMEILKETEQETNDGGQRQRHFRDFGFCGGRSFTRNNQGVTVPSLLQATEDMAWLFQKISEIMKTVCPKVWSSMDENRKSFSEAIVEGNVIEYMRLARTDFYCDETAGLCQMHTDEYNDQVHGEVVVFSQVDWSTKSRFAVILCTRKSVSDAIIRMETFGPSLDHVFSMLEAFPKERLSVDLCSDTYLAEHTWDSNATPLECSKKGIKYRQVECHTNPSVFLSGSVMSVSMMFYKFSLNYIELISLVRALSGIMFCPFYFCVSCIRLLESAKLPRRGHDLGWIVYDEMVKDYCADRRKKKPFIGLRWNGYFTPQEIGKEEFAASVDTVAKICLQSLRCLEEPSASQRVSIYRRFHGLLVKALPRCGELSVNHLLNLLAIIGLVPLWFSHQHTCSPSGKPLDDLVLNYGFQQSKDNVIRLYRAISVKANELLDYLCDVRVAENIVCNVFHFGKSTENPENPFHDLIFSCQKIFIPIRSGVRAWTPYGTIEFSGSILSMLPWNQQYLELETFVQKVIPFLDTEVERTTLPRALSKKVTPCLDHSGQHWKYLTFPDQQ